MRDGRSDPHWEREIKRLERQLAAHERVEEAAAEREIHRLEAALKAEMQREANRDQEAKRSKTWALRAAIQKSLEPLPDATDLIVRAPLSTPEAIDWDASTGLLLLPRGNRETTFSTWNNPWEKHRMLVWDALNVASRVGRPEVLDVPIILNLEPRPDNQYNPLAVAICLPPSYPGQVQERQLGWIAEHNLYRSQDAFAELFKLSDLPVGCHAVVRFTRSWETLEDWRWQEWDWALSEETLISGSEAKRYGYDHADTMLLLPEAERLARLVMDLTERQRFLPKAPTTRPDKLALRTAELRFRLAREPDAARHRERRDDEARGTLSAWANTPPRASSDHYSVISRIGWGNRRVIIINDQGTEVGYVSNISRALFTREEDNRQQFFELLRNCDVNFRGDYDNWTREYTRGVAIEAAGGVSIYAGQEQKGSYAFVGRFQIDDGELSVVSELYIPGATELIRRLGFDVSVAMWHFEDPEGVVDFLTEAAPVTSQLSARPVKNGGREFRDGVEPIQVTNSTSVRLPPAFSSSLQLTRVVRHAGDRKGTPPDDFARKMFLDLFAQPCGDQSRNCRLCDQPAAGTEAIAYCYRCLSKAIFGCWRDDGLKGPLTDRAIWALKGLAEVEFGGPPSLAQLGRVNLTDPDLIDQVMLCRMAVPRRGLDGGYLSRRKTWRGWDEWLRLAGLLVNERVTTRGTKTVASDGHLCRSMLERRVDDFFSKWGIGHQLEPSYPYHPDLNTTGLRADWLLEGGIFVEAWGLVGTTEYDEKKARKEQLANLRGIHLIGLTHADLPNLKQIFRDQVRET